MEAKFLSCYHIFVISIQEQAEKRDYEEAELTLKERLKMEKDAKKAAKLEKKRLAQEKVC